MDNTDPTESFARRAQRAYAANDFKLAAELFKEASRESANLGDVLLAAEMQNNASVAYLKAGMAQAALDAVLGTAQLFSQHNDCCRQAMALANQAAALEDLHRTEESLSLYKQAADLLKGSPENEMRSLILKRISKIQLQRRKPVEALFSMDAAVDSNQRRSLTDRIIGGLIRFIKKSMGQS